MIPWSVRSPDLNLIENLRETRRAKLVICKPRNKIELESKLLEIWQSFNKEDCRVITDSMVYRVEAVSYTHLFFE